ncbi:putative ribonuclease H-like domain-containing protein [Tanacetum coccineum]
MQNEHINGTNSINTVSTPEHLFERFSPLKNASTLPHVPNVSPMHDTRIFGNAYDDEDVEEEVDMNNVVSSYIVPDAPFTKFLKDHPKDQEAIDYDEVFVLLARIEAIRLFLAYASFKDFVVYEMDVKSAFLYGKIEEEVYVYQPPGFQDLDFPDKVYKVEKTLYGLHQAPRVYVDDIIFGSTKKKLSTEFEKLMHDKFQMSSMGELSFFLGLQVQQKSDGIFLSQNKYVAEILKKSMIGSLMYLTASRPDITFAVYACARFQVTPKTSHLHVVKRIFRYLKGQPKLGLWYPRDSPFNLEAFSDNDYAGASLDRKSRT